MIDFSQISLRDLAGYLSKEFRNRGIETILVGGACVTIYSQNRYQSYDLDFITFEDMKKVKQALGELGFEEKHKFFKHKKCPWFVEFVAPPVAIGNEPVKQFSKIRTRFGMIKMLTAVDSVKDRLASYYHWDDKQGLQQAIAICLEHEVDLHEVEGWSKKEGHGEKYKVFKKMLP